MLPGREAGPIRGRRCGGAGRRGRCGLRSSRMAWRWRCSDTSYRWFHASERNRAGAHDLKGSFGFDAGVVCLDFAHTGGEGQYAVFETSTGLPT